VGIAVLVRVIPGLVRIIPGLVCVTRRRFMASFWGLRFVDLLYILRAERHSAATTQGTLKRVHPV